MKINDLAQMGFYLVILVVLAIPLGRYMAKVLQGEKTFLDKVMGPLEKLIYRVCGINPEEDMNWRQYAGALIVFNILGIVTLFILEMLQGHLPFNPEKLGAMRWDLALNTAVSFVTNTNWQAYSPESTMSYFTQMAGFTVHNFASAATGIAVAVALIRGLTRRQAQAIGNFWVDLTRSTLRILLPLSLLGALLLSSQGVIQTLSPYLTVHTLQGPSQTLALGPVASQEAIKLFGTNGGGFFNANSAHPFENPTPFSNLLEMLFILLIPVGLTFTFGHMVKDVRQGRVIFGAALILFILMLALTYGSEIAGNPLIGKIGITGASAMEGKEVRFGVANSALFATVTTATSCGAVNAMHDSLTPLGGLAPMLQMMLGEVVFGGVGAGLYSLLTFVILTVFIVGLMVGRTPEYLGKKIEGFEMKMAVLAVLIPSACILLGSALASILPAGTSSLANPGPHGLSEMLYAFASGSANNGSAFAGLNANTYFWNLSLALVMFVGRFGVILPLLAIAGSMAKKKIAPVSAGTFQTTGGLFSGLLSGVVLIVGALTFFPALALGPIVEQLLMWAGKAF
ncbi:K+-transporting ATPase [Acididesulfobacillus acetoxydans]|uniref:Potassium-transporting ATPase potassium-binding subunit n=1 Tax=Acididesulfobacillus acetoxydans TaxID=1561005 RepID=A0A8S0Y3S7_9FIRM|nr:potassium-transporting ATPase subunit KdpA [Acididesulfobacillus acetoxydans]CAA7602365.1 K+-transporting ATPase [Acididesulfobacillus acetoxydans]CEJ08400.1 Potassium-transporting ATPase A chain [Acididesulfobacillus acetoxydans]